MRRPLCKTIVSNLKSTVHSSVRSVDVGWLVSTELQHQLNFNRTDGRSLFASSTRCFQVEKRGRETERLSTTSSFVRSFTLAALPLPRPPCLPLNTHISLSLCLYFVVLEQKIVRFLLDFEAAAAVRWFISFRFIHSYCKLFAYSSIPTTHSKPS